jgi:hypothetical protein
MQVSGWSTESERKIVKRKKNRLKVKARETKSEKNLTILWSLSELHPRRTKPF